MRQLAAVRSLAKQPLAAELLMSKKTKIEHTPLTEMEQFKSLTREQLLSLVTLPEDLKLGVIGKYHMRVEASKTKNTFGTPNWPYRDLTIKVGPYRPKTKRGIFDRIQQAVMLFGDEGLTGEQLARFIFNNLPMTDQRSPYTEGRPCVPWIEDYIAGAIAEKSQYLIAVDSQGVIVNPKKKETKKAA